MVVIKCIVLLLQLCNGVKFYSNYSVSGSRKSPVAKVPAAPPVCGYVGASLDNLEGKEIILHHVVFMNNNNNIVYIHYIIYIIYFN